MYETRIFWRKAALEQSNPSIKITDRGKYIMSYNVSNRRSLNISFLNFESIKQFKQEMEAIEQQANKLRVDRISITTRASDNLKIDEAVFDSLSANKAVELSKCGIQINQQIIDNLSSRKLPDDYRAKKVDYNFVDENDQIYHLILENFPDAFASNLNQVASILSNGHQSDISKESLASYFIIKYEDDIVGFAKSTKYTRGIRDGLVRLVIAVVDKEHRYKGLYKNLLRLRLQAGMDNGGNFAYTEADVTTSRPILERLGLEEFDRIQIYHKKLEA